MMVMLFLFLILALMVYVVNLVMPSYLYWKKRKISHVNLFVVLWRMLFGNESFWEQLRADCRRFYGKRYFGGYLSTNPILYITDVDLVKQIFIKDFEHFTDRFDVLGATSDPVFKKNLLVAKGKEWKELRTTMSPAFTNARMKAMFFLILEKAKNFIEYFDRSEQATIEVEAKQEFAKFTNDTIASCIFGTDCDSFKDPNNAILDAGKDVTDFLPFRPWRVLIIALFPKIFKVMKVNNFHKELSIFYRNMITDAIHAREKGDITRPDLIHLLLEARKGKLKEEHPSKDLEDSSFASVSESLLPKFKSTLKITNDVIAAQALVFYIAGHEATSSVLGFLAYELALQPSIQHRLIKEVDEHISSVEDISFEVFAKMKYLDQVISEALRKWISAFVLLRRCTKEYVIEPKQEGETRLVIPRNFLIAVPLTANHFDPKYFKNPDLFDPERFSEENKKNIVPGTYKPFGLGPRNCVAGRFALLGMKCVLVSILKKFEIQTTAETSIPIKLAKTFPLTVEGGFKLAFKKRGTV